MGRQSKYVLGIDVGTTTVRSMVFDAQGDVKGESQCPLQHIMPSTGWCELDPEDLWTKVCEVMTASITAADLRPADISALGISCQRASFTCWSAVTGRPCHNLITWKDVRADSYVKQWNSSLTINGLRAGGKVLHWCTGQPRYKAASILRLYNQMVTMRLLWVLDNVPGLREAADRHEIMFGCVDSWLLYKMTGKHMTEVSNIAATGIYDPFTLQYASWMFTMFNIPKSMMPEIVDSCGDHFGSTKSDLFGSPIPIKVVMADQSASVFASGCYRTGSAKITMGTGSFLDVVTSSPHASLNGLIPLVAWKIRDETVFLAEGSVHDTGVVVEWARNNELYTDISTTSDIASSLDSNGGVFFVPGFHGLQAPVQDPTATAGFIGLSIASTKQQMLRAILESIAFSQKQLVEAFLSETDYKFEKLIVDGGVARNNFILQTIANLTGLPVIRPNSVEMSVWGVASLAGLEVGIWDCRETLDSIRGRGEVFSRQGDTTSCSLEDYTKWLEACRRFTHWHSQTDTRQ